jgi:hypothetical protein
MYHSVRCRTGKEKGRTRVELIMQKLVKEVMRLVSEFSAGVAREELPELSLLV